MDFIKRLEPLYLLLMVLGGLNWLMIGLFKVNFVTELFGAGTTLTTVLYVVIGLATVLYLPKLFDSLEHMGDHSVRPHRA